MTVSVETAMVNITESASWFHQLLPPFTFPVQNCLHIYNLGDSRVILAPKVLLVNNITCF